MTEPALRFTHIFSPGRTVDGRVLLLLPGAGGDERTLLPLAQALAPDLGVLSVRAPVQDQHMARAAHDLAEGVLDDMELTRRAAELAEFVSAAGRCYGFSLAGLVAVGFSAGATIAASVLLHRAGLLPAAVLFAPMPPVAPERAPDLTGTRVFVGAGRVDALVPARCTEQLAAMLRDAGADVTLAWHDGGHGIDAAHVLAARAWLER